MKFMKLCAFSAIALMASFAFADEENVCITFSTVGPDKYADGTTVKDGEWYALVWIKDGATFQGVTTQLEAVSTDNEVMLAAPLASNEKCPLVMWQIDSSKAKASGSYTVVMLDTRGSNGKPAVADTNGKPKVVYASNTTEATVEAGVARSRATKVAVSGDKIAATGTAGVEIPTIEAFDIVGAKVQIKVSGMVPGLTYKVTTGEDPKSLAVTDVVVPQEDGVVIVDAGDAKFFSIQGE